MNMKQQMSILKMIVKNLIEDGGGGGSVGHGKSKGILSSFTENNLSLFNQLNDF